MTTSLYAQRRARVATALGPDGIAIIPTAPERPRNRDSDFPYRHDSYFYYLTGFDEPNAWLVLQTDTAGVLRSTLFCQPKDLEREIWDGFRAGIEGAIELYGADDAYPIAKLDEIIPGLIEGAADGAGLGHRFLKHLQRTGLLLHIIDLAPFNPDTDPVAEAHALVDELRKYDESLYDKPRWLVLNKLDMVSDDERDERIQAFLTAYGWTPPENEYADTETLTSRYFVISALTGEGTRELSYAIMDYLEATRARAEAEAAKPDVPAGNGLIRPSTDPVA